MNMIAIKSALGVMGFVGAAAISFNVGAEAANAEVDGAAPKLFRVAESEGVDAPSGGLKLRLMPSGPSRKDDNRNDNEDGAVPPPEPVDPGLEKGSGDYMGQHVGSAWVMVLDVSDSMKRADIEGGGCEDEAGNIITNATRLDLVKFETIKLLNTMQEGNKFDFILLAGHYTAEPITDAWKGELVEFNAEVKAEALDFVRGLKTWLGTPTYRALERATHDYGTDIDTLIFLTDGRPIPYILDNGRDHVEAVLADFPGWFRPLADKGCRLLCFKVGHNRNAKTFMADFAAANGAEYYER